MLFSIVGSKIAPAPALKIDPSMELKKVDVSSLDVVKWPNDVRDLATMSPKEISTLPKISHEQAIEMNKHNVWKSLDNKQIAVVALTQNRKVMPEQIAENAVNSQLKLKGDKKMSWIDILAGDSTVRSSTLIDVLESPKPRTAQNMFECISSMFGKKPGPEKSPGLRR